MADAAGEEWKTYDDFALGIDTYRKPNVSLAGTSLSIIFGKRAAIDLNFLDDASVEWSASGGIVAAAGTVDPYDAVQVREGVFFINLPLTSRERESITIVFTRRTNRAIIAYSVIAPESVEGIPQVSQQFWAGTTNEGEELGKKPSESRDLIGMRNVYRYSPNHLYEHVYISSQRYAWQCLEGAQRGHGDMDLSTVWKLDEGLYLFCFREFRIAVASVWLHDLGYGLNTTGIFLGISASGESMHSRAGGYIYPLGTVRYPDAQPI
jgi:hypothetical protein